jgi:hypothetical protein
MLVKALPLAKLARKFEVEVANLGGKKERDAPERVLSARLYGEGVGLPLALSPEIIAKSSIAKSVG